MGDEAHKWFPTKAELTRICISWCTFFGGCVISCYGMLLPRMVGRGESWIDTYTDPAMMIIGGFVMGVFTISRFLVPAPGSGDHVSPLMLVVVPYPFVLVSLVLPMVAWCRTTGIWIWRVMSIVMLAPWVAVYWVYFERGRPPPHHGMFVWAVGSTIIGLAVWIMPVRRKDAPVLLVSALVARVRHHLK